MKFASPLLLLVAGCASTSRGAAPEDLEAIGAVVDDWNRAWVVEDPVLAAAGYSEDAEFTNAFGFHRTGREEIERYLSEVFQLDFVMAGESREAFRDFHALRPDVVLVRSTIERDGQRTNADESLGLRRTSHLRVFAREDGEWRIVSHLISDARSIEGPDH